VFLLCSDGLTKAVTDAEIAAVIASSWSTAAAGLVDLALKRAATDNVTVGVVAFSGTDDDPPTLVRA
jgi:serine/threonine protein phosphatase PrpC